MTPITTCHNVEAIVVGSETMHYECPTCHESVNADGSNPSSLTTRQQLEKYLIGLEVYDQHGLPYHLKSTDIDSIISKVDAYVAEVIGSDEPGETNVMIAMEHAKQRATAGLS